MRRSISVMAGLACLTLVLACGCQTVGKGLSDEELIKGVLATWTAGIKAKDVDKVMSVHSEQFESSEATGKKEQREVLTGYVEMGYLDDAEVNLDGAEIKIEGDKASVTGVGLETAMGAVELEFELQKEKGAWLITGFEYY